MTTDVDASMGSWAFAFLLVSMVAAPVGAVCLADAHAWLEKMTRAVRMLNYEGTFVYLRGDQLEAMQIVHMVDDHGERERLLSLNGAAREVVRDNDRVTCIWPDAGSVFVDKRHPHRAFPVVMPTELKALDAYYRFICVGHDRMAGKSVHQVTIEPRDVYRYGYHLWLDSESALPLKSDLIDAEGNVLEQVMFTSLHQFDHFMPEKLEPATQGKGFTYIDKQGTQQKPALDQVRWKIEQLPLGFELSMHGWRRLPKGGQDVEHLVFTDGLASFSIYIERLGDNKGLEGASRMGAVSAYGHAVDEYQFTVVGEVPRDTVERVGQSIRPIEVASPP